MSDETKQLRCIICEATAWKNVDEFRYVPKQMIMCESCGFVTYAKLGDDNAKENLDEFYRESYRDVPSGTHQHFSMLSLRKLCILAVSFHRSLLQSSVFIFAVTYQFFKLCRSNAVNRILTSVAPPFFILFEREMFFNNYSANIVCHPARINSDRMV